MVFTVCVQMKKQSSWLGIVVYVMVDTVTRWTDGVLNFSAALQIHVLSRLVASLCNVWHLGIAQH